MKHIEIKYTVDSYNEERIHCSIDTDFSFLLDYSLAPFKAYKDTVLVDGFLMIHLNPSFKSNSIVIYPDNPRFARYADLYQRMVAKVR